MMKEVFEIFTERSSWFLELILEHIGLAGTAILIAGTAGLAIGIFLDRHQKCANVVLSIISLFYTIPDIAMFGFLIPLTGIGGKTAIIALTIYALLPMVRNTYTGLGQVDPSILEAAVGMGSTKAQVLFKVKLPVAFSVILAGVRNMVVMTISVAGIASFIGAGGLGKAIYRGISTNNPALMVAGSLLIALLAIFLDLLFGTFEKRVKKRWKM
ncbi:MAG: ABC transporter permease [Lachnospiraceae bacterium]|nr:ABC transporter permease [Lachnospiraceae bacterium]